MRGWTIDDASDLYSIRNWGSPYFSINDDGHVEVTPARDRKRVIDLKLLVDDLIARGINLPILLRFTDILQSRIRTLAQAFREAIDLHDYSGRFRGVFPVKVNQQSHIVEDIVRFGRPYDLGLEAGSKPELLVVLALLDTPDALIICNGYKDRDYIETAILAKKLGRNPVIVIEKYTELETAVEAAERLGQDPTLGMRVRLSSRGAGRWEGSAGDESKFGLTIGEIVDGIEFLREKGKLHCLKLLHFHIGSQVSAISAVKNALREATRIFAEMYRLGAPMSILDVGGGLGVDYDGSRTNFPSSMNYTVSEYAADVVHAIQSACEPLGVPHPDIVTESGRATVAYSSVLVFNVLGVASLDVSETEVILAEGEHEVIRNLKEALDGISRKNFQEAFHDALQYRENAITLFEVGILDIRQRAQVERIFWQICARILNVVHNLPYVPDELEGLERSLADIYYCNFSVFQSAPDSWAVGQLFPIMPIHRLKSKPTRRAILADITCDSDGKIDKFIDLRDVKHALELHPFDGKPYYLGMFLVGAYQEILGDLHNLFGDTYAVHVSVDEDGYTIDHVVEGDSVSEVLGYVQYTRSALVARVRAACEKALKAGALTMEESGRLLNAYQRALDGYTYLE
jgi:arginine decarboxylase